MLEPGWYFLPNDGTLSKSDLEILTVGFTSLLEQNLQLEVVSQNAPKRFRAAASTTVQDSGRDKCFCFSSVPAAMEKTTFIGSWKTISNVTGQDSERLLSNARLHHNHHMGLDKFFMPQLINFSRQLSSLACFPPPQGTWSVMDKQDGDLWKC